MTEDYVDTGLLDEGDNDNENDNDKESDKGDKEHQESLGEITEMARARVELFSKPRSILEEVALLRKKVTKLEAEIKIYIKVN